MSKLSRALFVDKTYEALLPSEVLDNADIAQDFIRGMDPGIGLSENKLLNAGKSLGNKEIDW